MDWSADQYFDRICSNGSLAWTYEELCYLGHDPWIGTGLRINVSGEKTPDLLGAPSTYIRFECDIGGLGVFSFPYAVFCTGLFATFVGRHQRLEDPAVRVDQSIAIY